MKKYIVKMIHKHISNVFLKKDKTKSALVNISQSNIHFEDIWCQIAGNGNAPPLEKNEKRMKKWSKLLVL